MVSDVTAHFGDVATSPGDPVQDEHPVPPRGGERDS